MSIQNTIDEKWMRVALSLSRRNKGATWPNPHVGCLIVKDEQVIGRGWTAKSGRPHAETQALLQAGENANGSTAYVTLEPCAHIGHTKPCSEALINAKVKRVVVSTRDLDPRVSGAGITMLEWMVCVNRKIKTKNRGSARRNGSSRPIYRSGYF